MRVVGFRGLLRPPALKESDRLREGLFLGRQVVLKRALQLLGLGFSIAGRFPPISAQLTVFLCRSGCVKIPPGYPLQLMPRSLSRKSPGEKNRIFPRPGAALILFLALLSGGCVSPGFRKAWKTAANSTPSGSQRWEGRWESLRRPGVGGHLRAVVEPAVDGRVQTYFEARWLCFLSAYKVSLDAKPGRKGTVLKGEQILPAWVGGGLYTYEGLLSPQELRAEYDSHHDRGVFSLAPFSVVHPPCSR